MNRLVSKPIEHMMLSTNERGVTLVETLICLALTAILFTLLNGLLTGIAKLSKAAEVTSAFAREMEFCLELMRKEIQEMQTDGKNHDLDFLGGSDFLSYTSIRSELIARDSIPAGIKRIEWRYNPSEKKLLRTVTSLVEPGNELAPVQRAEFLEGLENIEFYTFDGVNWVKISGISGIIQPTRAIAVRLKISKDVSTKSRFVETAFIVPYVQNK